MCTVRSMRLTELDTQNPYIGRLPTILLFTKLFDLIISKLTFHTSSIIYQHHEETKIMYLHIISVITLLIISKSWNSYNHGIMTDSRECREMTEMLYKYLGTSISCKKKKIIHLLPDDPKFTVSHDANDKDCMRF